jgi:hypothetical protein
VDESTEASAAERPNLFGGQRHALAGGELDPNRVAAAHLDGVALVGLQDGLSQFDSAVQIFATWQKISPSPVATQPVPVPSNLVTRPVSWLVEPIKLATNLLFGCM